MDGTKSPTGVWVSINNGQPLFSSLSLAAAEQLAHVLLAAFQAAAAVQAAPGW